jgi:hypothetical protein
MAKYGCNKCKKEFPGAVGEKDYSGFDRTLWPARDVRQHRRHAEQTRYGACDTATAQGKLESKLGLRYSPLLQLNYFDPIRMTIIDPMHNLFLGTAKRVIKVWLDLGVLNHNIFCQIQDKVDAIKSPTTIGRLPSKIASNFGGFTAEQWMLWTNVYSIYALTNVIDKVHVEIWRCFVLASRLLCMKTITKTEIKMADLHLMKFCDLFQKKYGNHSITPNMHLHGHLDQCLLDFGPVYSFWLFSFERYNGHIAAFPTNKRSVEVQFARRFLRDGLIYSLEPPVQFREEMLPCSLLATDQSVTVISEETIQLLFDMSSQLNLPNKIPIDQWTNISMYTMNHSSISNSRLTPDEQSRLKMMYAALYPALHSPAANCLITVPVEYSKCSRVLLGCDVFGSAYSRHHRSAYVMASWNDSGAIVKTISDDVIYKPGIITKIFKHVLRVDNKPHLHLIAQISWYQPCPDRPPSPNPCGAPVEIWSDGLYEISCASEFMPLQRVRCKFVESRDVCNNKRVKYVCPASPFLTI